MGFKVIPVPPPLSIEDTAEGYAYRLEEIGFDEMRIRKALIEHFAPIGLRSAFIFDNLSDARIRYVTMIHGISPAKTHRALVKKLAASLGISEDDAERSVRHYERVGEMPFIPWTRQKTTK